jgi:hypothetical protein
MRFHLLSYVAAMFLLAGVIGVNLTPGTHAEYTSLWFPDMMDGDESRPLDDMFETTFMVEYGWPFPAATGMISCFGDFAGQREESCPPFSEMNRTWHWSALALNSAIGAVIVIAGLVACESVLRRYAPRSK